MAQIHEIVQSIKESIGHIGKNKYNPAFKSNFRGIDDVLNLFGNECIKHKVIATMECVDPVPSSTSEVSYNTKGEKVKDRIINRVTCRVIVTLRAPDGSTIECSGIGEGVDYNSGHAANKAMSGGWKYAIALGLAIPCIGLDDNDNPVDDKASKTKPKPTTASAPVTTTPGSEVDPRTDALEVSLDDPCLPHQRETIIRYWQLTNRTVEQLREFLKGRNVEKLSSLTVEQASKLIDALANKLRSESIPF